MNAVTKERLDTLVRANGWSNCLFCIFKVSPSLAFQDNADWDWEGGSTVSWVCVQEFCRRAIFTSASSELLRLVSQLGL